MTCPSFTDLCARDAATALDLHLAACPRCRAIVARVQGSEIRVEPLEVPPAAASDLHPRPGAVWTLLAPSSGESVVGAVLEADPSELLIIPLLMETEWASEEDIVLPPDILGYPALASVWAADHVLAEQAVEQVDMLSEAHLALLAAAYDAFFAGVPLPDPRGAPVLSEEDPRIAAHAAQADDLRILYEPWATLHVAEELGPVVAHRRVQLDIGVEDLEVEPATWKAFEAGRADPSALVSAKTMARAVRSLGLLASRRLVALAHASVFAHHRGDDVITGPAMARRRRGVVPKRRRDPDAARAAADRYADALTKELGL